MSVIVKNMEMPKNCTGCPICCGLPYQHRDDKGRRPDCPLVELPPHGRLIDADAIQDYNVETFGQRLLIIDTAPTVIEGSET